MNDELCNEPNCGVCVRQDVSAWDDEYARLVTYVGDYVVLTAVAPELDSTVGLLTILSGGFIPEFLTIVGYVGSGSIAESNGSVTECEFTRFALRHDDFDKGVDVHDMIVEGVENRLIEVERILSEEEMNAQFDEGIIFASE